MTARPYTAPVFYISLLLAYLLFFYPLRGEMSYWRPPLVFVTVLFWLLVEPHTLGVGFAWLAGLALDLLTGGALGQNAFALAVCAYFLQLAGQRIKHFSVWHQILVVAILAFFYQSVAVVAGLLNGRDADSWHMLYPVISTVVLWPFLATLLGKFYKPE